MDPSKKPRKAGIDRIGEKIKQDDILQELCRPGGKERLASSWPRYVCTVCYRNPASGIWGTVKNNKPRLLAACGGCGLSKLPNSYERVFLVISISAPDNDV